MSVIVCRGTKRVPEFKLWAFWGVCFLDPRPCKWCPTPRTAGSSFSPRARLNSHTDRPHFTDVKTEAPTCAAAQSKRTWDRRGRPRPGTVRGPKPDATLRSLGFRICNGGCSATLRHPDTPRGCCETQRAGSVGRATISGRCCQCRSLLVSSEARSPPRHARPGHQGAPRPHPALPEAIPLGVPSGVCKKEERGQGCQRLPPADRVPPMGRGAWGGPAFSGDPIVGAISSLIHPSPQSL